MNLSAPFIQRPVMTTMAMLAVLFVGIIAYILLPISSMPDVTYPNISVRVTYPGALPETMANAVALPLEKQFMAIPGLRLVTSNNILGTTNIVLQFEIDKNMEEAAQDTQSAITNAIPNLPPELPYGPVYRKVNPAEQPIIYIALTSKTMGRADLYTYANTLIGQRISMLQGVSQVSTFGSILAVRVQVNPGLLKSRDVTLNDVQRAISLNNVLLSTGLLDGGKEAPIISVDGQLMHASDYDSLIVAYRNGTPVRIRDLGQSIDNFQNNKIYSQYTDQNGTDPSITIAVQKLPGANTVEIANEIYKLLKELSSQLPPAIDLHIVYDRSIPVRAAIADAQWTLIIALFLVVTVIFLFLGKLADTVIPSLVLPMSVIGTFIVMYSLGFTLDSLSVLALTLAVGFIIDDAVVVLENIVRRVEGGETPIQAAVEGSRQIGFTILSMSSALVAVFIPMLFMGGLIGKLFREFAITLTAITVISGIISLTLTPMLASRFIPPRGAATETKLSRMSARILQKMKDVYRKWLLAVIDHRITALTIGAACLVATIFLFSFLPTDFTPNEDMGFFVIYTQSREGGSSSRMHHYEDQLIDLLRKTPGVESFVSISSFSEYRKGINFIHLKPTNQREPVQNIIQKLYNELGKIYGLQAFIKNIPLIDLAVGQEARAAYQVALQGLSTEKIYPAARKLIDQMQHDPLFQGVNSDLEIDTPQINVTILRDEASRLGITANEIENAFSLGYSGNLVSRIETPIDQYDVILELLPEVQKNTDGLNKIWLRSATNAQLVPLSTVMQWEEALGASSINHIDQFPAVTISFNLAPGVALGTALDKINEFASNLTSGVSITPVGAAQTFQESISSAGFLLILTVLAIYIILGILYESFIHPITILTTLPPATLGGLLTLLMFGMPLSLYSFLGIILLIGIVKKNGIMMVDFALENIRLRQMTPRDAIVDACMVRFRPIMMTTVAAIFSGLPIALGLGANASARRPLGLVIIGGLFLSQFLTLFITPILYLSMEKLHPTQKP